MGLVFADRHVAGVTRRTHGEGFAYFSPTGRPLKDPRAIQRISSLGIPPAWRDVWIAPNAAFHIQATGFDARGRLQYRYHPEFRQAQELQKFSKLVKFAAALPKLRETVESHMRLPGIPRERALATMVHLLESTLIRIGNSAYARENESFGLSTLDSRHLTMEGAKLTFAFKGKSGKTWLVSVRDRRVANVLRAFQHLPGQKLFQYRDHHGQLHSVTSCDVNAYLKTITGRRISAKDFRTWSGTLMCAVALGRTPPAESQRQLKRQIMEALREASKALGNTPAVCRSSYVHPGVLEAHGTGVLHRHISHALNREHAPGQLKPEEEAVVRLLRSISRMKPAGGAGPKTPAERRVRLAVVEEAMSIAT